MRLINGYLRWLVLWRILLWILWIYLQVGLNWQQFLPFVDQIEYGGALGEVFESSTGKSQSQTQYPKHKLRVFSVGLDKLVQHLQQCNASFFVSLAITTNWWAILRPEGFDRFRFRGSVRLSWARWPSSPDGAKWAQSAVERLSRRCEPSDPLRWLPSHHWSSTDD